PDLRPLLVHAALPISRRSAQQPRPQSLLQPSQPSSERRPWHPELRRRARQRLRIDDPRERQELRGLDGFLYLDHFRANPDTRSFIAPPWAGAQVVAEPLRGTCKRSALMEIGLLLIRLALGLTLAAHGAQKLFGIFGGSGISATGAFFDSIGFRPGKPLAFLAGAGELLGGLALALGLLTPLAA